MSASASVAGQITIDELLRPRNAMSCEGCICHSCLMWWSNRCPHGGCYDDRRALERPYDAEHPGEVRKAWSNWAKSLEQAHWCRGGAFYPAHVCGEYQTYVQPIARSCLGCDVWVWADGYIDCPLVSAVGCEQCMEMWEARHG